MAAWIPCAPATALETDQFYAWGKPIEDSTEYLNAWVRFTIESVLESRDPDGPQDCESVAHDLQKDLQHSIYQPIELWILGSDLVDRVPRGAEEDRHYRSNYILSNTFALDFAVWLQPSPTVEVNGIRLGTDKLAHFFSEGWWYYRRWLKLSDEMSEEELHRNLMDYGVYLEKTVQGSMLTSIFSPADLESNYQGFLFYQRLCHGDEPLLYRQGGSWRFSDRFDFRDYVSPEWDESWYPNVYGRVRWNSIRKTIAGYCPLLDSDWVRKQRAYYARIDRQTEIDELLADLVAEGELPNPREFDVTSVCKSELVSTP